VTAAAVALTALAGDEPARAQAPPANRPDVTLPPAQPNPVPNRVDRGYLYRADTGGQIIVRLTSGEEQRFFTDRQTRYLLDRRAATLDDLRAGMPVTIHYNVRDNRNVVTRIEAEPVPKDRVELLPTPPPGPADIRGPFPNDPRRREGAGLGDNRSPFRDIPRMGGLGDGRDPFRDVMRIDGNTRHPFRGIRGGLVLPPARPGNHDPVEVIPPPPR
jgi:hypothetical protein